MGALPEGVRRLADMRRGDGGEVLAVSTDLMTSAPIAEREELERRLLEIGFVEGARIEVLHEGFIGRDPHRRAPGRHARGPAPARSPGRADPP